MLYIQNNQKKKCEKKTKEIFTDSIKRLYDIGGMMEKLFDKFIRGTGFKGILDVVFLSSTMRIRFAHNKESSIKLKDIWDKLLEFCNRVGIVCIEIIDVSKDISGVEVSPWDKYGFSNKGGIIRYLFLKENIDMEDIELAIRFLKYKTKSELVTLDYDNKEAIVNNLDCDLIELNGYNIKIA